MKYQNILDQMTIKEKCTFLSGKSTWLTRDIPRLGIPSMMLSDGPSGLRRQAGAGDHLGLNASAKATCIPSASTIANGWSAEIAKEMGNIAGADARSQGVQVLLGPGLNTKRSSLCGRSFEYYSEDPYLAGKLAAGFIQGVQQNGVSACAKHFAANNQETLRMHSDSVLDERTLRELYLTNFEIAIKEGHPHAVMSSYNKLNGTYTNENTHLYDILRKEWGFDGMVVTDWGGSNSYVEGIRAGMNLEMPAAGPDSALQLMDALKKGIIPEDLIDERIDTLLDLVLTTTAYQKTPASNINMQHVRVREAAEKCAVLLKNSNNILPLNENAKIAVIGDFAETPRYQGAGSSMVNPQIVDNTLSLLSRYFPNAIGYARGFERMDKENPTLETEAAALAKKADAVLLYIGLPEGFETEGLDRRHMRLPANQIHLIHKLAQINPHMIAVLSCGSAVEMPWIEDCEALVYGGLGGEAGAEAILRILCGKIVPGGKLAETFPISYDSYPVSKYYPGTEATSEYREGIYVGYRYYTTAAQPVCFPFGFGLSYTTFSYQNLSVSDAGVRFTITNTGTRDADEIAQMYISLPDAKIFRPALELKGFTRIFLKAGECREVTIPFDTYTFRYFNVFTNAFETEAGVYKIKIGASCEDIRLQTDWTVSGTNAPNPYTDPIFDCYRTADLTDIPDSVFEALLGRTLPTHTWKKNVPLAINDTFQQLYYAKNPMARVFCRVLNKKVYTAMERGTPNLNLLFIRDIPFRGISKMMGGMITSNMAEDILFMVNGHGFRGTGRLIIHFLRKPRIDTRTSRKKKEADRK